MTDTRAKPFCPDCDRELICPDCADPRPAAGQVEPGWKILTPLGRWEDVVAVDQPDRFGPVLIRTEQSGAHAWQHYRTAKVEAVRPARQPHGAPEVRIVEANWRTGPIHAVACMDTEYIDIPRGAAVLAFAAHDKDRHGWNVYIHVGDKPTETVAVDSKAAARTVVRDAGRRAAKILGVKFRIVPAS